MGSYPLQTLKKAILVGTNLSGANLIDANFEDANLSAANFEDALLIHTNLSGANLKECKGLTQKQIDQAIALPPDKPPDLTDVVDAKTGKPLVWCGALPREGRNE